MSLFQDISSNPLITLSIWLDDARQKGLAEPDAMTIASISDDGGPSTRTVLCKKIDTQKGLYFFTNYKSPKSLEIARNNKICAHFLWTPLARQVRIDGIAKPISRTESEAYFATRPRESQIGAWASPQSETIEDFEWLNARVQRYAHEFSSHMPVPCPPHWGGFLIEPHRIEFWEGKKGRLHDRVRLTLSSTLEWQRHQIAP